MRGIIETDQPLTLETVKLLKDKFDEFRHGKISLLVLGPGMHYIPTPSAKKRIRLAQSNRSILN